MLRRSLVLGLMLLVGAVASAAPSSRPAKAGPSAPRTLLSVNPWKKPLSSGKDGTKAAYDRLAAANKRDDRKVRTAMYKDLQDFPRNPDSIVFPTDNFGHKGGKTVRAKDFGWNAEDATPAIEKAFKMGAVVVLDKMDAPWRVSTIHVPDNKSLILEKGVRILAEAKTAKSNAKVPLFDLKGTKNFFLEGKGENYIGKYDSDAERQKYIKDYGGDGFLLDATEHVVIRNVEIANCGDDGICFSGLGVITSDVYLEDVTIRHNTRQGISICNANGVYMKNCRILDTAGKQPMAGIDFEPSIQEVQATANIYAIGCTFANNTGGNIVFSESSTYPVSVLFKDCTFGPNTYGSIRVFALCGLYMGNRTDAPSDIFFDNCTIQGYSWGSPFLLENSNLFHIYLRGGEIAETEGKPVEGVSPIKVNLNREYYYGNKKDVSAYSKEGSFVCENVKVSGWKGNEPISFSDKTGHYDVQSLHGSLVMNGKKLDLAKFRHKGADFAREDAVPPADFKGTAGVPPGVAVSETVPWWVTKPTYERQSDGKFRCTSPDGVFRLAERTAVWFEVPAGKGDAVFKIIDCGHVSVLKGRDRVQEEVTAKSLERGGGARYVTVKRQPRPYTMGIRIDKGSAAFKFFAPFTGVVSARPDTD